MIKEFIKKSCQTKKTISVVGDIIVDEYYNIVCNRISPEFPIPVMTSKDNKPNIISPGGAANVVFQMKEFNFDVQLFGFIDDYTEEVLNKAGINTHYCVKLTADQKNPVKRRFYHEQYPVSRWDVEECNYGISCENELRKIQKDLYKNFIYSPKPDALIFSDYNKGVFNDSGKTIWRDAIHFSKENIPTIVDPKAGKISDWKGCTVFKPNSKEALTLSEGIKDWKDQCDYFQSEMNCDVVITQGGNGVAGKKNNSYFHFKPENAITAQSTIGSGDAFVAFIAMAMSHKYELDDAVLLAFDACKVYVGRKYNKPVSYKDGFFC